MDAALLIARGAPGQILAQRRAQTALEPAHRESLELGPRFEGREAPRQQQRLGALVEQPRREIVHALRHLVRAAPRVRRERLVSDDEDVLLRQLGAQELGSAYALPALSDDPDRTSRVGAPGHDRGRFFSGS